VAGPKCEHKGPGHDTYAAAAAALKKLRANPKVPRLKVARCPSCGKFTITTPAKAVRRTSEWARSRR
jgi:hypothetical protein